MKRIFFLFAVSFSVLALAESHGYHQIPDSIVRTHSVGGLSIGDEELFKSMMGTSVPLVDDEEFQFTDANSNLPSH
jgi:hypothetical protein